jgi:hypothetical protein
MARAAEQIAARIESLLLFFAGVMLEAPAGAVNRR